MESEFNSRASKASSSFSLGICRLSPIPWKPKQDGISATFCLFEVDNIAMKNFFGKGEMDTMRMYQVRHSADLSEILD